MTGSRQNENENEKKISTKIKELEKNKRTFSVCSSPNKFFFFEADLVASSLNFLIREKVSLKSILVFTIMNAALYQIFLSV